MFPVFLACHLSVRGKTIGTLKCILITTEVVGGPLVSEETYTLPDADKKFTGSVIILEADSIEAARKIVEDDPYYANNVVCIRLIELNRSLTRFFAVGQEEIDHYSRFDHR